MAVAAADIVMLYFVSTVIQILAFFVAICWPCCCSLLVYLSVSFGALCMDQWYQLWLLTFCQLVFLLLLLLLLLSILVAISFQQLWHSTHPSKISPFESFCNGRAIMWLQKPASLDSVWLCSTTNNNEMNCKTKAMGSLTGDWHLAVIWLWPPLSNLFPNRQRKQS